MSFRKVGRFYWLDIYVGGKRIRRSLKTGNKFEALDRYKEVKDKLLAEHLPLFDCHIFPGMAGTGVGYHYAGRGAEVPSSLNDRDVSYELISMESTLWPKRFDSLTYRTCWAFVSGGYNWDEELQLCGHALSEFGA